MMRIIENFTKQNDKITTYSLENGVVKDIKFLSSTNELGNLLKWIFWNIFQTIEINVENKN